MKRGALALAAALSVASGAGAEVRRFEVVGTVAIDPAKPVAAHRQAALRAALEEAVAQAARNLIFEATGKEPAPAEVPALEGEPSEFAVSYRVIEDRGERDRAAADSTSPASPGPPGREYAVLAEVQIDVARVRERLKSAGRLGAEPEIPASGRFRLEIYDIPSPAVWTAVRASLLRAGAHSVVPLALEAGRTLIEVDSPLAADRILERALPSELPDGLGLEPLGDEGGIQRVRVRPLPPSAPDLTPEEAAEVLPDPAAEPAPGTGND